jgi:hypothetical protein
MIFAIWSAASAGAAFATAKSFIESNKSANLYGSTRITDGRTGNVGGERAASVNRRRGAAYQRGLRGEA